MISKESAEIYRSTINNEYASKEIKLYCVMVLLHEEVLGINAAFEILEYLHIFSKTHLEINYDMLKLTGKLNKNNEFLKVDK